MTQDEVCGLLGVSHETSERLEAFVAILLDWHQRMNLIGPGTVEDVWHRHVLDCGQLARLVPSHCRRLVDLGSGAGLPGLVLAIMGVAGVELVESDQKKAAFLHAAARAAGVTPVIHSCRAEDLPPEPADVVTARALAPLERLVPMAVRFMTDHGIAILPKGRSVDDELRAVTRRWHVWYTHHTSMTDSQACILVINGLRDNHHV